MSRRPRSIWLDVFAVNSLVGAVIARSLRQDDAGREFAFYSSLLALGPTTPTELAKFLGVPLTTVSDRLNRMVEREHATRRVNPADRRSYLFEATDEGRRLTLAHMEDFRAFAQRVLGRLDVPAEEIKRGLEALEDALRADLLELERNTPAP